MTNSPAAQEQTAKLSICILSWNTCQLLADCLHSLYDDPEARHWQVIVVDNDSADDSAHMVAAQFPQVELIRSEQNLGFAGATIWRFLRQRHPSCCY